MTRGLGPYGPSRHERLTGWSVLVILGAIAVLMLVRAFAPLVLTAFGSLGS